MRKLVGILAAAALAVLAFYWLSGGEDKTSQGAAALEKSAATTRFGRAAARSGQLGAEPRKQDAAPAAAELATAEEGRPGVTPKLAVPATEKDGFIEVEVRHAGAKVASAEVRLYWRGPFDRAAGRIDWRNAGAASTDRNGLAKLPARPGTYLAVARTAQLAPARRELTRPQGEPTTRVTLELRAGATVSGRTVAKADQAPVPLASVVALEVFGNAPAAFGGRRGRGGGASRDDAPSEELARASSDERGNFRLAGLEPGNYRIEAEAPGHTKAVAARVAVPSEAELVLELQSSAFIEGTVVTASGQPAGGALVAASSSSARGGALLTTAATDKGAFSLEVEPRTYKLSASLGREAATLDRLVPVAAGATARGVVITLAAASALEGTVVTSTGAPVPGAQLVVSPHRGSGNAGAATTDAAGAFAVEGLAPGSYDVTTTATGFAPDARNGVTVLHGQRFPLLIRLQGTGSVQGVVASAATGAKIANAIVSALAAGRGQGPFAAFGLPGAGSGPVEVRTDAAGAYLLSGLPPGSTRISVRRDGSDLGETQVADVAESGTARADFTLHDEGVLVGRVAKKSGAGPLGAVTVRASPSGAFRGLYGMSLTPNAPVDASGNYRLVMPAGTYNVVAIPDSAPGFAIPRSQNIAAIEAGQTTTKDLLLDDDPSSGVTGVVLEPTGEPSVGALVRILGGGGRGAGLAFTDDAGKFQLAGARSSLPATFVLSAANGGRAGKATVQPDQTSANVQLAAAGKLQGQVVGATPVKGFTISGSQIDSGPLRFGGGRLEFAGDRFQLDEVPPGSVEISVKTQDGRIGQATAQVAPGQSAQLEVPLQDSAAVTGRVVSLDGAPVGSALVASDGDFANATRTSADGRFRLSSVAMGDHKLVVVLQPSRNKTVPFKVAAAAPLDLGDIQLGPPKAALGTIGAQLGADGGGVVVVSVLPQGPAEQAGLLVGDAVVSIDGAPATNAQDATQRSRGTPGSTAALIVRRVGNAMAISVVRAAQ